MFKQIALGSVLAILAGAAHAATDQSAEVLNRHIAGMKGGDLAKIMADYADDALVITPHGVAPGQKAASTVDVFAGKDEVKKLFSVLSDKDHVPNNKTMTTRFEHRGDDVTLMYWVQNAGKPNKVSGVDVFVIRDGKIHYQDVTVDPSTK